MTKISIFYPESDSARFDFPYYIDNHMPMSIALLGSHPGFRGVSVERGMSGTVPRSAPAYIAICHFLFESVESFMAAFLPHATALQGDMPNYTHIEPLIQVSEVLISRDA